jgi:hypothetical protein
MARVSQRAALDARLLTDAKYEGRKDIPTGSPNESPTSKNDFSAA